ncbi:NLI interacting factor-like phosphatase family protein [Tritrichomonas foetus]|uniref:Mitochondrial import inner membrane translocase subunit TIM50 n=1 Tax=Tritrichomonas foetus TaxID=1144522 RepID=A0A1J4KUS5_9EUKA|nr:NLI interacting factor-like phosphatase family protein [Tritrichomonas foetus]|eukprot:OHT15041.1 NLI interacting factor-like phosphatase family protein [Tritrichomonas foetus]
MSDEQERAIEAEGEAEIEIDSDLDIQATPRRESPNRYNRFQRFIRSFSTQQPPTLYKAPPLPADGRKCLVLDMDETLVHCSPFPPHPSVNYFNISETEYVYMRPGLEEFMSYAMEHFEVFIYTFAERDYAELVLNTIAPNIDEDHRLYRDSCIVKKSLIIKDLDMLQRKKSKLIFVDDNDKALKVHKENTIVIPMWKGMPNDHALMEWLVPILEMCNNANDTRTVIKNIKNQTRRFTT